MNRSRTLQNIVCVLAASLSVMAVSTALGSDMGQAAANQVSLASYQDFLENWLYTHAGDNRGPAGPEHDLARDNIQHILEGFGLSVTLESFDYGGGTYENVVATKLGTTYPNQEYIIGAHYDSVSNPGADDNASGVALVLEAARIISQYESDYTIRFIAFDMEEQGLIGSGVYVDNHIDDDILGMISADMVAYDTGTNHARLYGRSTSNPIKTALGAAISEYSSGLTYADYGQLDASDHAPFEAEGFQACLLIEGEVWNNPYYHTQDDNVDNPNNIHYDYAVMMVRSAVGYLVDAAGVMVDVDALDFTYPDGQPTFVSPAGGTTMRVEVTGIGDAAPQPGTGVLHYDVGSGWESVAMDVVSDNVYDAVFPAADCGVEVLYYVSAEAVGGEIFVDPYNAPTDAFSATAAYGEVTLFEDDFETDQGWTVSGDATAGMWERGVPAGLGERGDPPTDYDGSGQCYLTGNTYGDSDVDGGTTHLMSPTIDLSDGDADVHYALWYTNFFGADPNNDLFKTYVSNNDGSNWVLVETIGPVTSGGWSERAFTVGDFVTPTALVKVRFEASDLNSGSVVEAGIDAFSVSYLDCEAPCPWDLTGDGVVSLADLAELLGIYGTCDGDPDYNPVADFNESGCIDLPDLAELLSVYGLTCP